MCKNEDENLKEIFENINLYKKTSLCFPPDRSMPIIVMLTEQLQEIYVLLTKRQQKKLDSMLDLMMTALEKQDFVLVRDILVYDIYSFFVSVKIKNVDSKLH